MVHFGVVWKVISLIFNNKLNVLILMDINYIKENVGKDLTLQRYKFAHFIKYLILNHKIQGILSLRSSSKNVLIFGQLLRSEKL